MQQLIAIVCDEQDNDTLGLWWPFNAILNALRAMEMRTSVSSRAYSRARATEPTGSEEFGLPAVFRAHETLGLAYGACETASPADWAAKGLPQEASDVRLRLREESALLLLALCRCMPRTRVPYRHASVPHVRGQSCYTCAIPPAGAAHAHAGRTSRS